MRGKRSIPQGGNYQIQVQGTLDPSWSSWFGGLKVSLDGPYTTLAGPVPDQSALRGILNKLWDLNLVLLAVDRIDLE
jgi:hypothetical protein